MNCPQCQLPEMWVEKAENNQITYKCKKCGTTKVVDMSEIEGE